jgi:hypothetical protein
MAADKRRHMVDKRGWFGSGGRHTTTQQSAMRECHGSRQEEMTAVDKK